jgi:hypothetical protein
MSEAQNCDSEPKRKPRRLVVRLTRNLVLYYKESNRSTEKHRPEGDTCGNQFCKRIKKEAWLKPIEFVGVIVLIIYTTFAGCQSCRMGTANRLTRQIIQSTISASLSCGVNSSFQRHRADEPLRGAFYVNCGNAGKVAAEHVSGSLILTAKSFPDERVLHTESWKFGGWRTSIAGNDGSVWPFYSSKFSPERERQAITDGKEIVIGDVAVSYADETGTTVVRKFCHVEMNSDALGGSPDGWGDCNTIEAIREILKASSSQKKKEHR